MTKRPAATQSTQSQSQSQSTPSTQSQSAKRPQKRVKLSPPPPPAPTILAEPTPSLSQPTLPPPSKRVKVSGKLKRLTVARPAPAKGKKAKEKVLSGAKVGGRSKDAEKVGLEREEDMMIARKGLGFGGYLKKGVGAFMERGVSTLTLHAMTAAIPLCLSLSLAIRDSLPGNSSSVSLAIQTGTVDVGDEIVPDDEDEDIVYQTRQKSSVTITLKLAEELVLNAEGSKRKSGSGRKRKGWGAGR